MTRYFSTIEAAYCSTVATVDKPARTLSIGRIGEGLKVTLGV